MKLDRNVNDDKKGKYALILMRKLDLSLEEYGRDYDRMFGFRSMEFPSEAIDFGEAGGDSEFFVVRLKDKYAAPALRAYAEAAESDDPEWATEVHELANRAALFPNKKRPD